MNVSVVMVDDNILDAPKSDVVIDPSYDSDPVGQGKNATELHYRLMDVVSAQDSVLLNRTINSDNIRHSGSFNVKVRRIINRVKRALQLVGLIAANSNRNHR